MCAPTPRSVCDAAGRPSCSCTQGEQAEQIDGNWAKVSFGMTIGERREQIAELWAAEKNKLANSPATIQRIKESWSAYEKCLNNKKFKTSVWRAPRRPTARRSAAAW